MKKNIRKLKNFKDYHLKKLKNPKEARLYLKIALEDYKKTRDLDEFLLALKDITIAQGGISKLARLTKLNRPNLQKTLSAQMTPRLDTYFTILHGLGYGPSIEPMTKKELSTTI